MDLNYVIHAMTQNQIRIASLVQGLPQEQARWKPTPATWSLLEVLNHLHDEEMLDFRVRLDILLHRPRDPWPPIDPEGWVTERNYNRRDPGESLKNFETERQRSLAWLKELKDPDWESSYKHPQVGILRAGDILASWLAHDSLHMRQLLKLHLDYGVHRGGDYSTRYAGTW